MKPTYEELYKAFLIACELLTNIASIEATVRSPWFDENETRTIEDWEKELLRDSIGDNKLYTDSDMLLDILNERVKKSKKE